MFANRRGSSGHSKHVQLIWGQMSPMAAWQIFLSQRTIYNPIDFDDFVSQVFPHSSSNSRSIAVDFHPNLMRVIFHKSHFFGTHKTLVKDKPFF